MKSKPKVILILGPTASGKTELSLRLAKKFTAFIISADSRQIYKNMDIGTAKPAGITKNNIYYVNNIPHFLIDIINPNEEFTLADWQKKVMKILKNNSRFKMQDLRFRLPMIVGGTGLYIDSIVKNYQLPPGKINQATRKKLQKKDIKELLLQLKKLDPDTFAIIDKKNKRRVVRALEYFLTNKKSFAKNIKSQKSPFSFLLIGLNPPREELYKRINKRVEQMIKQGLINEAEKLFKKYPPDLPALSSIGYREIYYYLNGYLSLDDLKYLIKKNTRHYAKRQLTWFKRDKAIKWIKDYKQAEKLVRDFLKN